MKKISCNIIRDILPLYLDDVVSDETKEMVEEHLQLCEVCRKESDDMKRDVVLSGNQSVQIAEAQMLKKFKKWFWNKKVIVSVVSVVVAIAVIIGAFLLLNVSERYIPYDSSLITVDVVDGEVYVNYAGSDGNSVAAINPCTVEVDGEEKSIVTVYYCTNLWEKHVVSLFEGDSNKADFRFYLGKAEEIDEVYYGEFSGSEIYEELPSALDDMDMIWSE